MKTGYRLAISAAASPSLEKSCRLHPVNANHFSPWTWVRTFPVVCIGYRLLAGPLLLWTAWQDQRTAFVAIFVLAVLSDIVDGIVARRLGVVTAQLREADSRADLCLYLCVIAAIWRIYPDVLGQYWVPLTIAIASQCLQWLTALIKYGRLASYHSYSAKIWGITLAIATVALFAYDYAGHTFLAALIIGIFHNLEEVAMTMVLPEWSYDVKTLSDARKNPFSATLKPH